jgi:hypothetical protein
MESLSCPLCNPDVSDPLLPSLELRVTAGPVPTHHQAPLCRDCASGLWGRSKTSPVKRSDKTRASHGLWLFPDSGWKVRFTGSPRFGIHAPTWIRLGSTTLSRPGPSHRSPHFQSAVLAHSTADPATASTGRRQLGPAPSGVCAVAGTWHRITSHHPGRSNLPPPQQGTPRYPKAMRSLPTHRRDSLSLALLRLSLPGFFLSLCARSLPGHILGNLDFFWLLCHLLLYSFAEPMHCR